MFKVLFTLGIIFIVCFIIVCLFAVCVGTIAYWLGLETKWSKAVYKAFKKI